MANNIYYGIPTYKRVHNQITLKFLKDMGISRDKIIMATQTEEDYNLCKELYQNECIVIYAEKNNLSGNRNTIIDYLPEDSNVLILDDDISQFEINKNGKLERLKNEHFFEIVERMFLYTRKNNGKLWGVYPVKNAYFMEKEPIIKFNRPIITVHGVITTKGLRYDEEQTVKEDYMFVCDILSKGYKTLRLENITTTAKHLTNKGGCYNQWGENNYCYNRLLEKHSEYLIPNKKRPGEVLLKNNIGKIKNIYLF